MDKETVQKLRIQPQHRPGLAWLAFWLFSIGFLHLSFWKGVLAIVIWPYFLGAHFAPLH